MNTKTDVMIDIETVGLKPGCQILSIGAVVFGVRDLGKDNYFYAKVNQEDERFTLDPKTLEWWSQQEESIRLEAFSGTYSIEVVLISLSRFLNQFAEVRVWGNAASFDLKIIEAAYEICGMPVPWKFYNEMCYRTLKNLFPQIPFVKPVGAHNAFIDARAQAEHADQIFNYIAVRA